MGIECNKLKVTQHWFRQWPFTNLRLSDLSLSDCLTVMKLCQEKEALTSTFSWKHLVTFSRCMAFYNHEVYSWVRKGECETAGFAYPCISLWSALGHLCVFTTANLEIPGVPPNIGACRQRPFAVAALGICTAQQPSLPCWYDSFRRCCYPTWPQFKISPACVRSANFNTSFSWRSIFKGDVASPVVLWFLWQF